MIVTMHPATLVQISAFNIPPVNAAILISHILKEIFDIATCTPTTFLCLARPKATMITEIHETTFFNVVISCIHAAERFISCRQCN